MDVWKRRLLYTCDFEAGAIERFWSFSGKRRRKDISLLAG